VRPSPPPLPPTTRAKRPAEPLLLAVGGGATLAGLLWLKLGAPAPPCPLLHLTGIPCPTCGATRCLQALLVGDLPAAFGWNPLIALLVIGTPAALLYAALATLGILRPFAHPGPRAARALAAGAAALLALNWGYLIAAGKIS